MITAISNFNASNQMNNSRQTNYIAFKGLNASDLTKPIEEVVMPKGIFATLKEKVVDKVIETIVEIVIPDGPLGI